VTHGQISSRQLDVLFVSPNSSRSAYQALADKYSAIEPPTWALLLAESCRSKGFGVAILDADAERLLPDIAAERAVEINPRLVCLVVYGQNPNSGTTNMVGALEFAQSLKDRSQELTIAIVGSHASALPEEVLSHKCIDIVFLNEGVYALHSLLASGLDSHDLKKIRGIGHKSDGHLVLNDPERVVPQERMDIDLPGYAWDLLPYRAKPLDLYRAHVWHADFDESKRSPFAAIYTSLGCRYGCDFCMINILNRQDNRAGVSAADSRVMRNWSSDLIIRELQNLKSLGVSTIRISDEMFFLSPKHFEPLVTSKTLHELDLRMWAYARVDTVRNRYLEMFHNAGIRWLALGIESGAQHVRREVSKGTFKDVDIREVVGTIQEHDINVISNYIFGFEHENRADMQTTLDLALELNTEMANMYPCHALPGSPMYSRAVKEGKDVPRRYEEFGFLSYETRPLPTKYLSSEEVLKVHDQAWPSDFTIPRYLSLVESKFGYEQRANVEAMASIRLKRKILGDKP